MHCAKKINDEDSLVLFYITNNPKVAVIAEKYGVNRIWIDLESIDKETRQQNLDTVKSHHTVMDIRNIKPLLTKSDLLVRINKWYDGSEEEIDNVINAGADYIMLPYWKTIKEVEKFICAVDKRCKTVLLLETKEAVEIADEILKFEIDEIHIGLNDLHLSYGLTFMFELLANGTVERLCNKFKDFGIPYGFGGISRLGSGLLPAEKVIMEHYRLGSSRAILSRSFCDYTKISDINEIERVFKRNMKEIREYEDSVKLMSPENFVKNKIEVKRCVEQIVEQLKCKAVNIG